MAHLGCDLLVSVKVPAVGRLKCKPHWRLELETRDVVSFNVLLPLVQKSIVCEPTVLEKTGPVSYSILKHLIVINKKKKSKNKSKVKYTL